MKKNRLLKIVGFACLFVVLTISVNAQKYTSVFKNLTWEQAAEQAQKEGKIVLVDAMRKARTPEDQSKQDVAAVSYTHLRYGKFLFRDQLSVTFNKADESPYGAFSEYAKLNPYWRAYNDDGSIREVMGDYQIANMQGSHPIYNPMINASLNTKTSTSYTDITNNFYAEWDAFEGMKVKGRFGLVSSKNDSEVFLPRDHTSFRDISPDSEDYFNRGKYTKGNGCRLYTSKTSCAPG